MDRERFEQLVVSALGGLPEEIAERMENIDVVVEDWPDAAQIARARLEGGLTLLGLYEGIPLTQRTSYYGLVPPDKITIFQKTIEAKCHDDDAVEGEIRRVVLHEVAHHFGISDAQLQIIEERKYQRRDDGLH